MKNNISKKSQNTIERLRKKANDIKGARIPSLKQISDLLTELEIEHRLDQTSEHKWRPNGLRYHTSGGGYYEGHELKIPAINLNMCNIDTYYSWSTMFHARDILKHILNN